MTLRKLANTQLTVAKMLDAEYAISAPAHHYFGMEEVKEEVEDEVELIEVKRVEEETTSEV
jgi:hypothetical protein